MQLKAYLTVLFRRKWVILIVAVLTTALAVFGTMRATPIYEAEATLYIATTADGDYRSGQTNYADRLKKTYAVIAANDAFLQDVASRVGLSRNPEVEVTALVNTELMMVTAAHPDAETAAIVANTVAAMVVEEASGTPQGLANPVKLRHLALAPENPASPRVPLNIGLGAFVGLAGGLGLALILENLDTTLYTPAQIREATDLTVVGEIPKSGKGISIGPSLLQSRVEGEAFRRLASNLFGLKSRRHLRSLLITGALPGEGKSTVAAGLAYMMAQAERTVLLVDTDFRRPSLHTTFNLENSVGLYDVLERQTPLYEAIHKVDDSPHLHVLTAGECEAHPVEVLGSPAMKDLLAQAEKAYELVVIDSPPLTVVPDSGVLAPMVDGVLLVVGQGRASVEAIEAAKHQLAIVRTEPVGVVINQTRSPSSSGYYYHQN